MLPRYTILFRVSEKAQYTRPFSPVSPFYITEPSRKSPEYDVFIEAYNMFDATRSETAERAGSEDGRELLRARGEALKASSARDVDIARRVRRRMLSRIAMFYIIIPAAIRRRSARRKTPLAQWNCHNTL